MIIGMFLDKDFPPDPRVENEAVSLVEAGHEVYLFSLSYNVGAPAEEELRGIKIKRYFARQLIYKLSALAYTIPLFHYLVKLKIRRFITKYTPDILYVHDMPLALPVLKIGRRFGLRVVIDLHENRPEIMKYYGHIKKFPGKYIIDPKRWSKAQDYIANQADHLVLVTNEAKNDFVERGVVASNKIVVVPNTVRQKEFESIKNDTIIVDKFKESFNILYIGDTSIRRGTDTAIKAMPILLEHAGDKKIKLIIVGKGYDDYELKQLANDIGVSENISFEGWQDASLFPSYISVSSVCLSPLKRNLHHDTTYANKLFQYMTMGIPVIVSDCPAQQKIIEDENCGLVFKADNHLDLGQKLIEIYSDKDEALLMGRRAKLAVLERWNWDKTIEHLFKVFT